jgi:hypothetical protein
MTVTTDVLIPALEDVRGAHAAVVDRFWSVAPAGAERHIAEVKDHIAGIDRHVSELRPDHPHRDTAELVRIIAEGAVRTSALPLQVGARIAEGIVRGPRPVDERRLLRNAEDEYAIAARALAACRVGQSIAEQAHDQAAVDLLASLRRQDEQLLEALEDSLAEHARAVAPTDGGRPAPTDGGLAGAAARAVRTTAGRIGEAARSAGQHTARVASGAARRVPGVTRMAEEIRGAASREEDLPIPGYGRLCDTDVIQRLRLLSPSDLAVVEGYERAHAARPAVLSAIDRLSAIERLRGGEPWDDYDAMTADQISSWLKTAGSALARQVLEYEQSHQRREAVITAATQRTSP